MGRRASEREGKYCGEFIEKKNQTFRLLNFRNLNYELPSSNEVRKNENDENS
jgi:hypothetical protein